MSMVAMCRARSGAAAATLAVALLLGACAGPVTSTGMVPKSFDVEKRQTGTVSISVTGGRETDATGLPQVSNAAMAEAVTNSLKAAGMFTSIVDGPASDYRLAIQIFRLQGPVAGFNMTANIETGWTLTRAATNAVLWQEAIEADYTATPSDAFSGAERARLAAEGAARESIRKAIARLSRLTL